MFIVDISVTPLSFSSHLEHYRSHRALALFTSVDCMKHSAHDITQLLKVLERRECIIHSCIGHEAQRTTHHLKVFRGGRAEVKTHIYAF